MSAIFVSAGALALLAASQPGTDTPKETVVQTTTDVLIVGSGFLTHGLPFLRDFRPDADPPGWSREFDAWSAEALARGDVDELMAFRDRAPGMPYAHPTVEHFAPLFVTLGAASDAERAPDTEIEGFFLGLAKRSFQIA